MQLRALTAGLSLVLLTQAAVLAAPGISVQETPLGNPRSFDAVKAVAFGADSRRLAFIGVRGEKQYVVRDGVEGEAYDWVIPDSLTGPLDLSRVAFIIQNGNDLVVVVDGQVVGKGYYFIGADRINFSEDGKHFAYTARRGSAAQGNAVVVRDGVEGKPYPLAAVVPTFSPDGNHLAYAVSPTPGKNCMVLDGKEQSVFDAILPGTTVFSADSKHLAYTASLGGKFMAVVDGVASKPYEVMRLTPNFSPDSSRIVYIAGSANQFFVVADGVEGPKYDTFTDGSVVYSPDSKHLAYAARKGKQWVINVDGKEQPKTFDGIAGASIHFSPDSARLGFVGIVGEKRFVVVDGKQQKGYDGVLWPGPVFSPDSKRLTFAAASGEQAVVVTDDVEGPAFESVAELAFSPDSKHFSYRGVRKSTAVVVLDGRESPPFDNTTSVAYSTDGAHSAYAATSGALTHLVIDGAECPGASYSGWVKGSRPSFSDARTAHFLMARDEAFLQVQARIPTPGTPAALSK